MPPPAAVIYAKDCVRIAEFYAAVTGMTVSGSEASFVRLESPAFELYVVAVPAAVAASIHIADPPDPRANAAIKLAFPTADLAVARRAAESAGGRFGSRGEEWQFLGLVHCDGHDPEGNVFQLRQRAT